jgi:5,10-methylenetetrahydromethanopterin reductase
VRFSIRLNNDLPVALLAEVAQAAEQHGFDQVWVSHDLFLRSAPVALAVLAERTSRIRLGVGILNPYSVHPAEIAMTAATLQEVSAGRFLLGLSAGAEEFLSWAGIPRPQPLTRTRRAVTDIRALLAGQRPGGWPAAAHLRLPTRPTPIYVGGMSPRMLAMAGECADGALALLYPPEHYPTAAAQVLAGVERAGRDPSDVDVPACVWVSVAEDPAAARAALADKIAYYGPSFAPYLLARAGLSTRDFEPVRAALAAGGPRRAREMVTGTMLALGIAGDAEQVVDRCMGLVRAGARHVSFGPPLGPDLLTAVDILGRHVLPALRGHGVR